MTAEDVRTLEDAADLLMRNHCERTAIKLYALALKMRTELRLPSAQVVIYRG